MILYLTMTFNFKNSYGYILKKRVFDSIYKVSFNPRVIIKATDTKKLCSSMKLKISE